MNTPANYLEVFLQPGELYFGDRDTRIRTLLGSCVAVTLWHPQRLVGSMCHCLLPATKDLTVAQLDSRYIEDALLLMIKEALELDTNPADYEVKVFGGGDMFPTVAKTQRTPVGERNAQTIRNLLQKLSLPIKAEHLGGLGHRVVIFNVWSGEVFMKHMPPSLCHQVLTPTSVVTNARHTATTNR